MLRFAVLSAALLSLVTTGWSQTAAGSATVEGRVFNAATGSALANARVVIEGSTREALTDESGGYRITGLCNAMSSCRPRAQRGLPVTR
jgi:hypothetical protein